MAAFLLIREQQRNHLRRNRVFRDRLNPLDAYNDTEIIARYRLSRPMIMELYDEIGEPLEPATMRNHSIPGMHQIFIALRYYASGSFYAVLGDGMGVHKSTVSRIVTRVTAAICNLFNRYIVFPRRRQDIDSTKQNIYNVAGMPNVLGAIDGTLICIVRPKERENLYVSRKGGHSLNILAICNSDLIFTNVIAKYPGATNDSFIWLNSHLHDTFLADEFGENSWLLGDSGFGLSRHLLTPILNPTNEGEERYNASHKQTRQVIERCFGLAKLRFRCMHKTSGQMMFTPEKCCKVVVACFILHNKCIQNHLPLNDNCDDDEMEDQDPPIHQVDIVDFAQNAGHAGHAQGQAVRTRLINQRFGR